MDMFSLPYALTGVKQFLTDLLHHRAGEWRLSDPADSKLRENHGLWRAGQFGRSASVLDGDRV